MMGVGKSTLGKTVANKQGLEFIDTDFAIEKRCSMKISEIFSKKGEKFFRIEEEKEVLKALKKNNCVIALGGGAFLNKSVRSYILKNSLSINVARGHCDPANIVFYPNYFIWFDHSSHLLFDKAGANMSSLMK